MEKPTRVLCCGDQHGSLKGVEQVLERANYDPTKDMIVNLGDIVDGWGESSELVQFWIDLQKEATHNHIFICGNHDQWCYEWMKYGVPNISWMSQGGASTYESYQRTGHHLGDEHRKFFKNQHNYYVDDQNRGFVHGGYISRKGLGHEVHESSYYWDRDLWNLALMSDGRVHEGPENYRRFEKHKEVFIGHTSTLMWDNKPHYREYKDTNQLPNGPITVPMNRCNVWNLDTGGGFAGKITLLDVDTKKYWQSEYSKNLYPNEKGR